jgi:outer membrane receptor protein involved in Fe transport
MSPRFPTRERGQDFGYRADASFVASMRDTVRIGNELDTDPVQGYDGIDPAAVSFNATRRARTDVNIDSTLLVGFRPDDRGDYTLGLARKNRSPNLYERYAWGTNTIGTVTWFGDGNGYTGNPDLKPETADTASVHVMPLHGTVALEHAFRAWSSALSFHTGNRKTDVDPLRLEPPTPGYSLVDLRTAYVWRNLRLDFAITNLLDRQYASPLGGTWQSAHYPPGFAGATFRPLPAAGRSLDTGFSVKF